MSTLWTRSLLSGKIMWRGASTSILGVGEPKPMRPCEWSAVTLTYSQTQWFGMDLTGALDVRGWRGMDAGGGSRNRECRWRQAGIGGGILVEKSFLAERI